MDNSVEWGATEINPRPTRSDCLFIPCNDRDEKMTSTVLKFADDTKISSNSQQEL